MLLPPETSIKDLSLIEETDRSFEIATSDSVPFYFTYQKMVSSVFPVILVLIALLSLVPRITNLPETRYRLLLDNDSYRFYHQAQVLDHGGTLFPRDMTRWAPLGRDMTVQLVFWPRVLQAAFFVARKLHLRVTPIQIAVFSGPVVYALALIVYGFLVRSLLGWEIGLGSALLLALFPGNLYRSMAGFADRDDFCLLLMFCAYLAYLALLNSASVKKRLIYAGLCGGICFLLGWTWEGCILLTAPLALHWLLRVLREPQNASIRWELWLWTLIQMGLLLPTRTYRSFSAPFALAALGVPLSVSLFSGFYALAYPWKLSSRRIHLRSKSISLPILFSSLILATFACLVAAFPSFRETCSFFTENIVSPLGQNRLFRTIDEIQKPTLYDWWHLFQGTLIFLFIGAIYSQWNYAKRLQKHSFLPAALICICLFISIIADPFAGSNDVLKGSLLFLLLFLGLGLWNLLHGWKASLDGPEAAQVASEEFLLLWFFIELVATRGEVRYFFFLAPPAFALILRGWNLMRDQLQRWLSPTPVWEPLLLFWSGIGLQAYLWFNLMGALAPALGGSPGGGFASALEWLKTHTQPGSTVLGWWPQGAYITQFAERKTVVDEDTYRPYWIYWVARAFTAPDSQSVMPFMTSHRVDYLMLTSKDIADFPIVSYIGSKERGDSYSAVIPLARKESRQLGNLIHITFRKVLNVDLPLDDKTDANPKDSHSAKLEAVEVDYNPNAMNGEIQSAKAAVVINGKRHFTSFHSVIWKDRKWIGPPDSLPGTLIIQPFRLKSSPSSLEALYIPPKAAKSLMVRLFLSEAHLSGFEPVYDSGAGAPLAVSENSYEGNMRVKIWRIHYPPTLLTSPKYLAADFPPGPLREAWSKGAPYSILRQVSNFK